MARLVKALSTKACWPEFSSWNPHPDEMRELISELKLWPPHTWCDPCAWLHTSKWMLKRKGDGSSGKTSVVNLWPVYTNTRDHECLCGFDYKQDYLRFKFFNQLVNRGLGVSQTLNSAYPAGVWDLLQGLPPLFPRAFKVCSDHKAKTNRTISPYANSLLPLCFLGADLIFRTHITFC